MRCVSVFVDVTKRYDSSYRSYYLLSSLVILVLTVVDVTFADCYATRETIVTPEGLLVAVTNVFEFDDTASADNAGSFLDADIAVVVVRHEMLPQLTYLNHSNRLVSIQQIDMKLLVKFSTHLPKIAKLPPRR